MPEFLSLSADEVEAITRKQVRVDLDQYIQALENIQNQPDLVGGVITLRDGETMPVAKRRMTRAASMVGKKLKYRLLDDGRLAFTLRDRIQGRRRKNAA